MVAFSGAWFGAVAVEVILGGILTGLVVGVVLGAWQRRDAARRHDRRRLCELSDQAKDGAARLWGARWRIVRKRPNGQPAHPAERPGWELAVLAAEKDLRVLERELSLLDSKPARKLREQVSTIFTGVLDDHQPSEEYAGRLLDVYRRVIDAIEHTGIGPLVRTRPNLVAKLTAAIAELDRRLAELDTASLDKERRELLDAARDNGGRVLRYVPEDGPAWRPNILTAGVREFPQTPDAVWGEPWKAYEGQSVRYAAAAAQLLHEGLWEIEAKAPFGAGMRVETLTLTAKGRGSSV